MRETLCRSRYRAAAIGLIAYTLRLPVRRTATSRPREVSIATGDWILLAVAVLGLHPNVCACHYVRGIDGVPSVFAEYVDGGSLAEWIGDGRLYAGDARQALARVLDTAVQAARGLEHAHRRDLVHQDVKPATFGTSSRFCVGRSPRPSPAGRTVRCSPF